MKKILLVDDAAFMRELIRKTIEDKYEVKDVSSGKEAIELFNQDKPEVMIIDMNMPEMDGVELIKSIRKIDTDTKIIVCSSNGQQYMVREAIMAGADNYITKPFGKEAFLLTIEKTIAENAHA